MKHVLVLGASGQIGPYLTPGLESDYYLHLADITPHPSGKPIIPVDVTSCEEVVEASRGMDAIINLTVIRSDPVQSFEVNTKGAYHVMKAAAEHGIKKVIHTGPQWARGSYDHDCDVDDTPPMGGTGYYGLTKLLSLEICKVYARTYGIQTICFVFNLLGPKPTKPAFRKDFEPFTVVWEDLQHACRLALEIDTIPDNFQAFNLLSYLSHGKYLVEKAKRILGYTPLERVENYFTRGTYGHHRN
ncbi:MAG: NAD(P)-dependent oxidoreductase [Candidatus Latescibacteria bacterium]|nr:NAD(P)-dependent oxidoreductase [Candidatus Latescibacterota bacterium]